MLAWARPSTKRHFFFQVRYFLLKFGSYQSLWLCCCFCSICHFSLFVCFCDIIVYVYEKDDIIDVLKENKSMIDSLERREQPSVWSIIKVLTNQLNENWKNVWTCLLYSNLLHLVGKKLLPTLIFHPITIFLSYQISMIPIYKISIDLKTLLHTIFY